VPAAWWGTAIAVTLSVVLGVFLAEFAVLPIWEAVLAAVAAALVDLDGGVYAEACKEDARRNRRTHRIRGSSARCGPWMGVFLLVLLMITREGMEMAFITATLARQEESVHMFWGALVGIALAAGLAWAWSRYGHRINLGLFFQVTSIFLVLFALQLLAIRVPRGHRGERAAINNQYWHIATEPYGPEGQYGAILTYALVLLPALWIAWSAFGGKRKGTPAAS